MFRFFKKTKEDIADKVLCNNVNHILDEAEAAINLGEKTQAIALLFEANNLQESRGTIIDETYFRVNDLLIRYLNKYGW